MNTSVVERLSRNPIVYQDQRCITLALMDEAHERPRGTAKRAFHQHHAKLASGKHFFEVPYALWKQWGNGGTNFVPPSKRGGHTGSLILLTERGYLLLVKSFHDDLAWQVQEALVDGYFAFREQAQQQQQPAFDLQQFAVIISQAMVHAIAPLVQASASRDGRQMGDAVEARYRIRQMWPGSTEPQRKWIVDQTTTRIRELGGVLRNQYGRILIEREYLHVLDQFIDLARDRAYAKETIPLFDPAR